MSAPNNPSLPPDPPVHIHADHADFLGNQGRGRYVLLPGSRGRALEMASRFSKVVVKSHPRGHDLHLGSVTRGDRTLDVAVISTGMGCPSIDLVVSELIALGARVLVRVGTCGSLQPDVKTGALVVPTAAVRDEGTSDHYLPREFPALPSIPLLLSARRVADRSALGTHFGPVHTKDSLYARELGLGPLSEQHRIYRELLRQGGVLASEMECAHLFVLAQLGVKAMATGALDAAAVLAVVGDDNAPFHVGPEVQRAIDASIDFALDLLFDFDAQPQNTRP
jgi:uridine phosphorylase